MYKKDVVYTNLFHNNISIPITIKKFHLSKKLSLKPCFKTRGGKITIPLDTTYTQAKNFANKNLPWLYSILNKYKFIPITKLDQINYLGKIIHIKYLFTHKKIKIQFNNDSLLINYNPIVFSIISTSIKKFLIKDIRKYFTNQVNIKTSSLKIKYNKIFIKDNICRWGSCSNLKNLSFNWRLAFAPKTVIDYVICHEVAHLVHFNHSKNFWNLVKKLHLSYKEDKTWLQKYGYTLYKIVI